MPEEILRLKLETNLPERLGDIRKEAAEAAIVTGRLSASQKQLALDGTAAENALARAVEGTEKRLRAKAAAVSAAKQVDQTNITNLLLTANAIQGLSRDMEQLARDVLPESAAATVRQTGNLIGMSAQLIATAKASENLTGASKALAQTGSVVGAAMAGWQLGRMIADVTGLDEKIQNLIDTIRGLGEGAPGGLELVTESLGGTRSEAELLAKINAKLGTTYTDLGMALAAHVASRQKANAEELTAAGLAADLAIAENKAKFETRDWAETIQREAVEALKAQAAATRDATKAALEMNMTEAGRALNELEQAMAAGRDTSILYMVAMDAVGDAQMEWANQARQAADAGGALSDALSDDGLKTQQLSLRLNELRHGTVEARKEVDAAASSSLPALADSALSAASAVGSIAAAAAAAAAGISGISGITLRGQLAGMLTPGGATGAGDTTEINKILAAVNQRALSLALFDKGIGGRIGKAVAAGDVGALKAIADQLIKSALAVGTAQEKALAPTAVVTGMANLVGQLISALKEQAKAQTAAMQGVAQDNRSAIAGMMGETSPAARDAAAAAAATTSSRRGEMRSGA